jgi:NAD(P)H-quinone oxidoreductase subunit 5
VLAARAGRRRRGWRGLAAAACAAWFLLSAGARALLSGAVAQDVALRGAASALLPALVVLAFAAALVLQAMLPARMDRPRWRAAYVHLLNGGYVNARVDRWLRRAWPLPAAAR